MTESPQSQLLSLFQSFFKDVEDYTSGFPTYSPEKVTFSQDVKLFQSQLQRDIKRTEPNFIVQDLIPPPVPVVLSLPQFMACVEPIPHPPSCIKISTEKSEGNSPAAFI